MPNAASTQRSPTNGLLLGLVITLTAVLAYAFYITVQLAGLRKLQSEMVDRNRKDSLQLLRVQNDLNSIALAMRDMLDTTEPYPLTAWTAQFERIHQDLDTGLKLEESLAGVSRTPEQRLFLSQAVSQFWDAVNRMFALAQNGRDAEAREQIRFGGNAHRHCSDKPLPDSQQPPDFCAPGRAFRAAQRLGAKTDLDSGIYTAAHITRTAR